jgi:hypothetical protein
MAQDLFTSLRNYASKLSGGEKSATEMAAAFKGWLEESGEMIKERIETEIDAAAIRRGFIRQEDLEEILQKLADLEKRSAAKPVRKKSAAPSKKSAAPKKANTKNRAPGKPLTKEAIVKSSVKKSAAKKSAAKKKSV